MLGCHLFLEAHQDAFCGLHLILELHVLNFHHFESAHFVLQHAY